MIFGKSLLHVPQKEGKIYSFDKIMGYYNDLTEKVLRDKSNYHLTSVITAPNNEGRPFHFPIAIFQYGLGAYDLYLMDIDKTLMKEKFLSAANWACSNQNYNGSWTTFHLDYPKNPFSSMAQGEGASLLLRAFKLTGEANYLLAARKALEFMLLPLEEGGTTDYTEEGVFFYEFTCFPLVYNGWVFSIFGLLDYVIETNDKAFEMILDQSLKTFVNKMQKMDNGYWSMYRDDRTIASPFYHNLHMSLLKVLYEYTSDSRYLDLINKFKKYSKNPICKTRAILKKAFQKLIS